jgi:uncharacterized phage-associated protein
MEINATKVGQFFLSKNKDLTDIQIQKLVYYAYSWYMVVHKGKKIFDEQPEAWIHGPVFRSLFNSMKSKSFLDLSEVKNICESNTEFLNTIYSVYGKYSGNTLERMTHSELPWKEARKGLAPYEHSQNKIKDSDIIKCYSN